MAEKTKTELAKRVAFARTMLESHHPRGEIKRALAAEYGVSRTSADRIVGRAREEILLEVAQAKEWMRAQSLAFYAGVIRDDAAHWRDKIRARQSIDKLMGLYEPVKVAVTDVEGRDLSPDQAREIISTMAARIFEREQKLGRLEGPPVADGPTID